MDTVLARASEPPLGAHLVVRRGCYLHHGIYVGAGRVIHYSARALSLMRRPVEEVSLACFSRSRIVCIRAHVPGTYQPTEIVRRARSRLGEDRYRLLTNNCEHFCEWCARGEHRSTQIEALHALLRLPFSRRNRPAQSSPWNNPRGLYTASEQFAPQGSSA
jgi:Lecithin retinol acyltransferase